MQRPTFLANVPLIDHAMVQVYQNRYMAQIMALVAEEQSLSADKVETQTEKLISLTKGLFRLTIGLLIFTFALLAFTVVLSYDTHKLAQRESIADHRAKTPDPEDNKTP